MKANDFNLSKDLNFDFAAGVTSFRDTRVLLFSSDSIGLLRQQVIDALGMEKARRLFLRFGYQHGYADFMRMKINYHFDNEAELMRVGPMLHTWEGIAKVMPDTIRYDRQAGEFYLSATCLNSYEAEQHLCFNSEAKESVCWSIMGYASGWCSGFFGSKVISIEERCCGKGDDCCYAIVKPLTAWDSEYVKPYAEALEGL